MMNLECKITHVTTKKGKSRNYIFFWRFIRITHNNISIFILIASNKHHFQFDVLLWLTVERMRERKEKENENNKNMK